MVELSQGEIRWAELADPSGSGPGFRRPVLVIQGNAFNRSRIATVLCAMITSNTAWRDAPGNVYLSRRSSRLPKSSVVNVSQLLTLDREQLGDPLTRISPALFTQVLQGIDIVLGR